MWYSAQIADAIHKYGPDYGFNTELKSFNWKKLVENRQAYISRIHTSYDTGLAKNNVDVIRGFAKFLDAQTIEVNGETYTADHILIATGTQAFKPEIEGAEYGIDSNGFFGLEHRSGLLLLVLAILLWNWQVFLMHWVRMYNYLFVNISLCVD